MTPITCFLVVINLCYNHVATSDRKLTKKSRENAAAGAVLEKPLVEQGIEDNGAPTSSVLVTLV